MKADIIIIGGGLAGLVNAIYLSQKGLSVLLFEKNEYPIHKVCGEYISNEVLSFLDSLSFDPFELGAKKIDKFLLSSKTGKIASSNLSMGGFSISRYTLDAALAKSAKEAGTLILHDTVLDVGFENEEFKITTKKSKTYIAKIVIGAYGKRTQLDKKLNRKFISTGSPYLAVKAYYKKDFPENTVALHNFEGGYCGLSKIENDYVNVCYITDYTSFKKYKNIEEFQEKVLYKNPHLCAFFKEATPVFDTPLTISQISFSTKSLIEDHVFMCGDSAGMIHPLCGNGMSMAIQSAQLLSMLIYEFFSGEIISRSELEMKYRKAWNREFKSRLRMGKLLASLFKLDHISQLLLTGLSLVPGAIPTIIERTHGKPLTTL